MTELEMWTYILETLHTFTYDDKLKWLRMHNTLQDAYKAAQAERDGMIAT